MGRSPCCDKTKVKRGPWSPQEDSTLKNYIHKFGTGGNWIALPHKAGLSLSLSVSPLMLIVLLWSAKKISLIVICLAGLERCGKSCRLRWLNYLRPDIKHGGFTEEEDNIILTLYNTIGTRQVWIITLYVFFFLWNFICHWIFIGLMSHPIFFAPVRAARNNWNRSFSSSIVLTWKIILIKPR